MSILNMTNTPKSDDEIARTVLIELLAYQFCFPVQWIETQDLILGSQGTERLIEIGPTTTLANMAKRTVDLKYAHRDMAQNTQRQFLNFQQNIDAISYNQHVATPDVVPEQPPSIATPVVEHKDTTITASAPQVLHVPIEPLQDSPVTPVEIVSTVVAAALKKPMDDLEMNKSIKALAGGRSTLQNEIIGDLATEFDAIPDGAEDLPLDRLCASVQSNFGGKLGKKSSSMVERLVSQKMPSAFQTSTIRKHLNERWGLGPGRQDSVLLWTVTSQPGFRLKDEGEAKVFLDGVVHLYAKKHGLSLPDTNSLSVTVSVSETKVSSETVALLENKQKSAWLEQLRLYSNLLGLDMHASEATIDALQKRVSDLENELDAWADEHGEFYASGIQPMFAPLKARTYDSWWNWVMQDLLTFVALAATPEASEAQLEQLQDRIVSRANDRLISTLSYLVSATSKESLARLLSALLVQCQGLLGLPSTVRRLGPALAPFTKIEDDGKIVVSEKPRLSDPLADDQLLRLGRKGVASWKFDEELSSVLHDVLQNTNATGLSFAGTSVLVTGAGEGSIGCQIVAQLLTAGAIVVVTSSSYSPKTTRFYQKLYAENCGKGSKLILVPFNQASVRDVDAIVDYIYSKDGLAMDLDFVVPFAAISENGRTISNIDGRSELAHRVMLTNTLRLLGNVKQQKMNRGTVTRPAQVILPLSPNHGSFGSDGLYAESKLGLEALFEKFHSEDWADYLLVCGAIIGWTRGTSLMSDNDMVAEGIEKLGVRTYSQTEMAFNIVCLLSEQVKSLCIDSPLVADLSGGMGEIVDLQKATADIRASIAEQSDERRALALEASFESSDANAGTNQGSLSNIQFAFPELPGWNSDILPLNKQLKGMVDLDRVVVVVGYSEIGPCGNSRTRWNMELNGPFLSTECCIELAWTMGLIKSHHGVVDGQPFSGWVEKETGKPIADHEIPLKFGSFIREHSGIRFAEAKRGAQAWKGREVLHEIEVSKDHDPIEVSKDVAAQLKQAHGESVHVTFDDATGQTMVVLRKGAKIGVPKMVDGSHTVAGQIPTGWDARTYGVPEDVVEQVDPVTLYALVATAESFQSAGILDPFELYNDLHVSEVASCVGSGFGGITSMREIFQERYRDMDPANDALAECFINSSSAWINMLLLSAAGPNRTPVGACATSVESLDTACDLIQTGKAKFCVVGGCDDLLKETSTEFANMKATIDPGQDALNGRDPTEMSRPTTTTRKGFVESEGAGIQLVTTATVALDMGLPIHCIVALSSTAMDKAGRSLPAPGRGILGAARQSTTKFDSPLMNLSYRRRALQARMQQVEDMRDLQLSYLDEEVAQLMEDSTTEFSVLNYRLQRVTDIESDATRDQKEALDMYGNHFWTHDQRIAPIRGGLGVWGLSIDDIDLVSFHGTSTVANEKNEAAVVSEQFKHLGRTTGNIVPVICQKALTGHPKAAAGAWMLNGCIQAMHDKKIPGNRNADNIDSELQKYEYLVFPNKTLERSEDVKAFLLNSFGFGQKGAMAVGVNPKYLFATLKQEDYEVYANKRRLREKKAVRRFHEAMHCNTVFRPKKNAPYAQEDETAVLLDPEVRFGA
ncbi:fatty acid synthase subunit alpha reductase [Pyrenophora seminiperda CCB06]|uniref:beta-ketoacyl-[acyl-carrier-protein] synthase I n=1 Tax=Pyrenophora seminiperda CCB06 TaxID=1302712 RepID=A0A3M7M487_9PLEO|nr:fatty acid synthase subunit alpha reductase [Pyrenophora seminiperda CCB06]